MRVIAGQSHLNKKWKEPAWTGSYGIISTPLYFCHERGPQLLPVTANSDRYQLPFPDLNDHHPGLVVKPTTSLYRAISISSTDTTKKTCPTT